MNSSANRTSGDLAFVGYKARLAEAEELAIDREKRASRSDTRTRLLVAALELFAKNGWFGAPLDKGGPTGPELATPIVVDWLASH